MQTDPSAILLVVILENERQVGLCYTLVKSKKQFLFILRKR